MIYLRQNKTNMHIKMDVSLDATLGCGQAHRWIKNNNVWEGVIGKEIIHLTQLDGGFNCEGSAEKESILKYFRNEDDLKHIVAEISKNDPLMECITHTCPYLRILRQDKWECLATYLLATNVNVRRISKMVESVCNTFGKKLGSRYSFPSAEEILNKKEEIPICKLGFREGRFIELAEKVECGEISIEELSPLNYEELIKKLKTIKGVGPKVADCVALFSFDCLEAFPVDVRISKCLEEKYGVTGNYQKLSEFGRKKFGQYAGYAQEYLYLR